MLSESQKALLFDVLFPLFYLKYKDFSIDQLQSFLLEFYQRNNFLDCFEIVFLESLIEIRSN